MKHFQFIIRENTNFLSEILRKGILKTDITFAFITPKEFIGIVIGYNTLFALWTTTFLIHLTA